MRESIRERSILLRIAPGLVEPLPVLVPAYGIGIRGRLALRAALAVNELTSWTRNQNLEPGRQIPRARLLSREECLQLFPAFAPEGLTGGALWYDAQLLHPERLTLSFVRAAADRGAVAANYIRVDRLRHRNGAVTGASVIDRLTGAELDIQARAVLVTAGPWTREVMATLPGAGAPVPSAPERALGLNVAIGRRLADVAVGVRARSSRREDPVGGGRRFLFLAPQGEATLLGTWYTLAGEAEVDEARATGVRALIREFNDACPGLRLTDADVLRCHSGWLPLKAGNEPGRPDALAERPRVVDHGRSNGLRHLISVEGVKYTTARRVAEHAVDRVFTSLGWTSPPCRTAEVPLPGAQAMVAPGLGARATGEEVVRAVREEMAVNLSDIVFRRTALGTAPGPERAAVEEAARVAGKELSWDKPRQESEIDAVMRQAGVSSAAMEAVG